MPTKSQDEVAREAAQEIARDNCHHTTIGQMRTLETILRDVFASGFNSGFTAGMRRGIKATAGAASRRSDMAHDDEFGPEADAFMAVVRDNCANDEERHRIFTVFARALSLGMGIQTDAEALVWCFALGVELGGQPRWETVLPSLKEALEIGCKAGLHRRAAGVDQWN